MKKSILFLACFTQTIMYVVCYAAEHTIAEFDMYNGTFITAETIKSLAPKMPTELKVAVKPWLIKNAALLTALAHTPRPINTEILMAQKNKATQMLQQAELCSLSSVNYVFFFQENDQHAVAFRQMSLLMRRAPGREAYPGDVFYLHARLLGRAGKLISGGSLTALPIVQIQNDDITAYVPTNLISITDGQLFLDAKLFNQGVRPAVNVELSVSRVGGAAQTNAIKKMSKALRLELAQYHELLNFAQFGAELDEISQMKLKRGGIVVELMKQAQFVTYNFVDQSLMLFLLKENFLNDVQSKDLHAYAMQFVSFVSSVYKELYDTIFETQNIDDAQLEELKKIAREFDKLFVAG